MESPGFLKGLAKADFADALGVVVRPESVIISHLAKRFRAVKVLGVEVAELDVPDELRNAEIASIVKGYVGRHGLEDPRISLVPCDGPSLLASMMLPASAADNASEIIGYELDRLFPVPPDSLVVGHSRRGMGSSGERICLSVVALPREPLLALAEELRCAGVAPGAATTESAALADYCAFGCADDALVAVFASGDSRERLTLVSEGLLVSSHHVSAAGEGREALVEREIEASLPERSSHDFSIFVETPSGGRERSLDEIAPEGFVRPQGLKAYDCAVAMGAALGRLGEGRCAINLMPPELIQDGGGLGLREMALSGAVIVMALVLASTITAKNAVISSALADELDRLTPLVEEVVANEDANRVLLEKTLKLEAASRSDVLTYMREITRLVPTSAYLTTFRFREDRIEVDGIADSASGLIGILEASPYFERVDFTAPTTKYLQTQERFSLRMRLVKK